MRNLLEVFAARIAASSKSVGRRIAAERDGGRARDGTHGCPIAHIELHLALEAQLPADGGARTDDDARYAGVEMDQAMVGLLHVNAVLDARVAADVDIAVDGGDATIDTRGGQTNAAVHVLERSAHEGAVAQDNGAVHRVEGAR